MKINKYLYGNDIKWVIIIYVEVYVFDLFYLKI